MENGMFVSSFTDRLSLIARCREGLCWFFTILIAVALCCSASEASATPAPPLHTSGPSIVDANGSRVRLNAFNWYGAESSDYVVAGLQIAPLQSIVSEIKSLGFNAVRLPWSNQMYESNPVVQNYALTANPTMNGENAMTIFDQVVNALTGAGIMVILDNHNSNAEWCCSTTDGNSLWYNSQYPQASWIADWQGMAQRYQTNSLVIGADLRNEPRGSAAWGGSSSTDWHAAAQLGGNSVLSVNPNLLVFVEGVNYAGDLSAVSSLPIQLNVANQLVYEAHDYGFWYTGLTSYSSYVNTITPKWGYLVTGSNQQPLWIGEFGTCNTAKTCVNSNSNSDGGYWFSLLTAYIQEYGINWSYWAINGTESTGASRTYGAAETYGVLNAIWNGVALESLSSRLENMMTASASPNIALLPGGTSVTLTPGAIGATTISIVPLNGFTGTVNLSCSVSGPGGAIDPPTCSVPPSQGLTGTSAASATVSISTTGAVASNIPGSSPSGIFAHPSSGVVLGCAFLLIGNLMRRRKGLQHFLIAILALVSLSACGSGKSNSTSTITTSGTYTIQVIGTAPGLSPVSTQISLNVQ
jgi:endoglucanase